MGDCSTAGREGRASMFTSMKITEKRKFTQQARGVVFFQYRPYRKGARKAPAIAPQEIPISCAMKVTLDLYWIRAMITEIRMKSTISQRMIRSCFFSSSFLKTCPRIRSSVIVELEVRTSEDRVDMEAESTRMTTTPIRMSGRPESMVGTTESYPFAAISILSENRRPKPPRK